MHGDLGSLLAVVICGVFVAAALPVTIPLLRRAAAIDQPSHRSSHTVPTPRGGGITLAIGLIIAALLIHSAATLVFGFTVGVFAAIGWADDLAGLPALRRLGMQAAASLAAGWLLVSQVRGFGTLTVAAVAATVIVAVWLAGFVNVFNFMDGVNGISAAHAILGGTAYFCLGLWRSDQFLATGGAAVVAVSLAFLPWNLPRARVFLGDVGSYGLGAALALLGGYAVLRGVPVEAALGSLALYLADTGWTLQRRIRTGEQWLQPHRTHAYQRLCDTGWSHQRVTLVTGTVTAAASLLGAVSLTPYPGLRAAADLAAIALLGAYLRAPAVLGAATGSTGKHRIQSRVA